MSTNSVYVILLSIIFDGQTLSLFELLGVISGLVGVIVIAFGENIKNPFCRNKEITKVDVERQPCADIESPTLIELQTTSTQIVQTEIAVQ